MKFFLPATTSWLFLIGAEGPERSDASKSSPLGPPLNSYIDDNESGNTERGN